MSEDMTGYTGITQFALGDKVQYRGTNAWGTGTIVRHKDLNLGQWPVHPGDDPNRLVVQWPPGSAGGPFAWDNCLTLVEKAPEPEKATGLPTSDAERKALPIFTGPLMYFPDALLEVARVCKVGNDQHNPGQPLHWNRAKSTDQMNTAARHMMDHGMGNTKDVDGTYHMAKAAWRCLAELQLTIEKERGGK